MELNLLGNDEIDDLDFDYIPINNLPVSYFPFKDVVLLNELKKINNENLNYGEAISSPITITSVYKLLVKKKIKLRINTKEILFEKGVYIFYNNLNSFDIVKKNNREFYKAPHINDIVLNIEDKELHNIANISSTQNNIELSNIQLETADNPDYKLIVYKNDGTLTLYQDIICDILIVGGGGNGGWYGGGGGGGGVIEYLEYSLKSGDYTITIGNINIIGNNGNTTIKKGNDDNFLLGAGGGGNGGGQNKTASNGSISNNISGGGGGGRGDTYGSIKGGKNGGSGFKGEISGGGGGAGGLGEDGNENKSGDGGNGKLSKITNKYYGGGGGGAYYKGEVGKGGKGGGGKGGSINSGSLINTGDDGETNTGGGGGGTTRLGGGGGFGGSGIVIIRVANKYIESINDSELISSYDTRIINDINNELNKKLIEFNNNDKPYNYLGIYPLMILILFIWLFIFLFLLKFVHHYFTSIYLYILIGFIIILLIFGSMWFLYTNNDLL